MMVYLCVFFCKQKTADEMRISDWSSDGCSSDLLDRSREAGRARAFRQRSGGGAAREQRPVSAGPDQGQEHGNQYHRSEERRVGKSVSVRVDLGGRRIIKKQTQRQYSTYIHA